MMEFGDIATLIQTGGHTALMVLLWLVYQNWRTATKSLSTLQAIEHSLNAQAVAQKDFATRFETKVDNLHNDVIELPVNIMRVIK